ncbi:uncharacterized protein LOC118184867 [Stegodyphus dumicola]|uniref:uncharacterized protein LOC118184867 n=1 Tax=Stegodyphus dumicola TaxID=202533 RepID=UPI0015B0C9D7|nr:uncharacterized protein LOC118184867 [Stegodyphus dumicola]
MQNEDKHLPKGQDLEIFSDGSKVSEQVGAAYIAFYNNTEIHSARFRLSDQASVFQAESFALKKAALWAGNTIFSSISFYTDSMSVLQALNKNGTQAFHISSLKEVLITLFSFRQVSLYWVRSHQGIQGNERADSLAKEATSHHFHRLRDTTFHSRCQTQDLLRLHVHLASSLGRLRKKNTGRHTYSIFPVVFTKRLKTDFYLQEAFTNHGRFSAYLSRFCHQNVKCLRYFSFFSKRFTLHPRLSTHFSHQSSFLSFRDHIASMIFFRITTDSGASELS